MATPIGIAVIGLGVIGRRMLEQTARRQDLRVVSAWDLGAEARARAQADFPGLALAADAEAAIAAPGVDIVYVGTPPGVHRQYSLMAARHGRRVFCADGEADHAFVRDAQLRAADIEPFIRRARRTTLVALQR